MTPRKVERGCLVKPYGRPGGLHTPPVRKDAVSLDPKMKWIPRKAIQRAMGGAAKYKSGSTGPIRVFRNLFQSQIHIICPLSLTHLGLSSNQQPWVKSSVVSKGSQKQSSSHSAPPGFQEPSEGQSGKAGGKTSGLTNPKKLEIKENPYHWIAARIHHLEPKGYVEEIHSFRHFHMKQ